VRVDVTANSDDAKALLKRFHLFGPPATIFLDEQGREIVGAHVIGFESADRFLTSLARVARAATAPALTL
jgi:thiol:disulfide interchange protein DsbD